MPSSTVRREQLVSPLNLAIIVGIFALAFYLLKPDDVASNQLGERLSNDTGSASNESLDELELAYLRVLNASGKVEDADVAGIVMKLLDNGRLDDAKSLLENHPELKLSEALRFELDLHLSAANSDIALIAAIRHLLSTSRLHEADLVQQALHLSKRLAQPVLTLELYHLAASQSSSMAYEIYRKCGDYFVSRAERKIAVICYQDALGSSAAEGDRFDVELALLRQLDLNSIEQQRLMTDLMDQTAATNKQLEALAPALLSIEHPEAAYRIYARLGLKNSAQTEKWMTLAAQWATAAGKPLEAAIFLDSLVPYKSGEQLVMLNNEVQTLLIAAGRNTEAFERIRKTIAEDSDNTDALSDGIQLAMQLQEADQALLWNTQWLEKFPRDLEAMQLQGDLALAATDLPEALRWAKRQVELAPQKASSRVRLAQVSEWSGSPSLALTHWQWLSKAKYQPSLTQRKRALREVVRLGSMLLKPGEAALALRELTLYDAPNNDDIEQLVQLYELDGRAVVAATAVQDVIILHGAQSFYLRTLATLEYRHKRFSNSLVAWEQYVEQLGPDTESTLARMELLWRLDKTDEAAQLSEQLKGNSMLSLATDYQLKLMSEISWRYRMPWLAMLVQPQLDTLDAVDMRNLYARRSLDTLSASGEYDRALQEAVKLWASTGHSSFALQAMQLAVKTNNQSVLDKFSAEQRETDTLQSSPEYWMELAAIKLRNGDTDRARQAYQRALKLDQLNTNALAGLLWINIGEGDETSLQTALQTYSKLAVDSPELWQAMAVGYLQLGAASTSLIWFDKLLDQIETDYGMLLTYADALEYAGRAGQAHKVRQYTLQRLRPVLIDGSESQQSLLLRQYGRLSTRYGDVESNEQLVDYLLANAPSDGTGPGSEQLWRQDMAISWLMATQQHEHARLIMAQLHTRRLRAPAWQQLAVALKDENTKALEAIVQAKGPMSVGNHILALRQLGNDRQAYALAQRALLPGAFFAGGSLGDRLIAQEQYSSLRSSRPSYLSGSVNNRSIGGLTISETGFTLRHTLAGQNFGLGLQVTQRRYDSDQLDIADNDELSDVALSLYFGNTLRGGRITTGLMSAEDADLSYASGRLFQQNRRARREIAAEIAYNEAATNSAELLIAGRQHRATLTVDQGFGRREFVRLSANATQINTRVAQDSVARGLGGTAELGMRGTFGSNAWSASVRAGQISYDRENVLPSELQLSEQTSFDGVLAKDVQSLSLGASLSRGGVNGDFPQVSSPRYYLNTSLGQIWPDRAVGFQLDAGAGIRVLGGDELSFSVTHDTLGNAGKSDDSTAVGVNYRYHF